MKIFGIVLMILGYIIMTYRSYKGQNYWRIAEERLGVNSSEYRNSSWSRGKYWKMYKEKFGKDDLYIKVLWSDIISMIVFFIFVGTGFFLLILI